jgi:hypothetical protein
MSLGRKPVRQYSECGVGSEEWEMWYRGLDDAAFLGRVRGGRR